MPPETGCEHPVVDGKVIGNPNSERTAKKPKAWASRLSPCQPAISIGTTSSFKQARSSDIKVRLCLPPPETNHRIGREGSIFSAFATHAAVNAVKVAAPSSFDKLQTESRLK